MAKAAKKTAAKKKTGAKKSTTHTTVKHVCSKCSKPGHNARTCGR